MRRLIGTALLFLCQLSVAGPAEELEQQLAGLDSLQGRFEQQVLDVDESVLEHSSGVFKLLQPGYFYWHIRQPDEQVLYAAGSTLWHYDVDLETATRRDIAAELSQSPLAVFSGESGTVKQLYAVEQPAEHEFTLVPQFPEASFVSIRLRFEQGLPVAMWVVDRLEQTTYIRFLELESNVGLVADEFDFIPPPGIDVYYHDR
jgi:outer membrane lipoprotein carrier protein